MKIEVDPQQDMKNGLCSFCHKPVTLKNGWLEFYVENDEGNLRYPTFEGEPLALFAHAECGPDCGYPIQLARMTPATASLARTDSVPKYGWHHHISEKNWACKTFFEAIRLAEAFVKKHSKSKKLRKMSVSHEP